MRACVILRDIDILNDGNQDSMRGTSGDPLCIHGGPITRVKAKKMWEVLNGLVEDIWAKIMHNKGIKAWRNIKT